MWYIRRWNGDQEGIGGAHIVRKGEMGTASRRNCEMMYVWRDTVVGVISAESEKLTTATDK